jgi:ABC-type multidrug transport system ATPase subunit
MDEPTASLDPDIADKTLSLIEELNKKDSVSILYTSHNMNEVTRICDEVIFLDMGEIVARDTPLGLTKRITESSLVLTFDGERKKVEALLSQKGYKFSFPKPYAVKVEVEEKLIPKIIFQLGETGIWITDIEVKKPTLEDVFLHIARKGKNVA